MSKFTRGNKVKKKYEKPWLDPNYDALKTNKRRSPPISEQAYFQANIYIAQDMLKTFPWRPWMEDFINKDGTPRPFKKGIIIQ